ncbi:Uncharacterised protein [Mycobacterium tuberculosis]|uniref:Uncharacterized protein n=1 Tax=Mycobacterium tuberculosis TaxID=1773 RepID=A0A654U7K0_MYCTX|nr:Uncharacterised protein [Mycobacterium tuberculosis]COW69240.1 Uncharacterised protein [Mycobacterium tuberculosis]COX12010.1 Uncharacterised protein [Mycobacterium tuberculosis]COZ92178.1 Uncharacterised protein [Mycobacterium tuberculosis]
MVYLPPAMATRPAAGTATACSRDSLEVSSLSPASSGRSPAYTPSMSACVNGVANTALTVPRM